MKAYTTTPHAIKVRTTKAYTSLAVRDKFNNRHDWDYSTVNVKNNGGLTAHIRDIEKAYDVTVIGVTQFVM